MKNTGESLKDPTQASDPIVVNEGASKLMISLRKREIFRQHAYEMSSCLRRLSLHLMSLFSIQISLKNTIRL